MSETDLLLINSSTEKKMNILKFDVNSELDKHPPLGLAYLASSCKFKGYKPMIIDLEIEHIGIDNLIKKISSLNPKLIGISCTSLVIADAIRLAQIIKKNFNTPIVLGGHHTNIDPESLLKEESIDFLIRGEGEESIVKLMDYLNFKDIKLKDINSLSYRKKGKIFHNPKPELKRDLDKYPFPDRSLFKNHLYFNPFTKGKNFVSLIATRGCPFNCIFCNPMYKRFRKRSVKNVIAEIKKEMHEQKTCNFEIFDETFNFPPEWVMEFCDEIIKSNLNISFRIRCRPDLITDEKMVRELKKAGCYLVSLGVESVNNKTLKFLNKSYDFEQIKRAIRLIKDAGIEIHGYFILGSPVESKGEMLNTINFSLKSRIDFAIFSMLTPLPGTQLYKMAHEKGWWEDKDKLDYSEQVGIMNPILKHPTLSKEELAGIHKKAYFKFYLRWQTIFKLARLFWFNPLYSFHFLRNQLG